MNTYIPKGDTATITAAFIVISGVILTALQVPASEIMIGAGLGWLFKTAVKK